jgi:hypothetical protein
VPPPLGDDQVRGQQSRERDRERQPNPGQPGTSDR